MKVIVPSSQRGDVAELVQGAEPVDAWSHDLSDGRCLTRIVLNADRTEAVSDALRQRFAGVDGFRLVLLRVEATVPLVEEPEEEEAEQEPTLEPTGPPGRLSREELHADVVTGAEVTRVYVITTILAGILAAVGLIRDDVIILVGAMVVAPLLGPNMALAFATTLGDVPLAIRSLKTNLLGVALALGFSVLVGLAFNTILPVEVDLTIDAIMDRTTVGMGDVFVALAAGIAGALTFTTGLPSALVGVMVAVALLPPLVNAGLLMGMGRWSGAGGALTLVLTNVVCLNLAGVVTFMAQQIRPRTWWEEDRARKARKVALAFWAGLLLALLVVIWLVWGR